jgi:hypothetical protein
MVDVSAIKTLLTDHFDVYGDAHIDPETGIVDVEGGVILAKPLRKFPVQFGTVTGKFTCSDNRLESLVGAPHTVGDIFGCTKNRLTSLVGGPQWVGGGFLCSLNQLTSLVGAPDHVGRSLQISDNPLKSLNGMPVELKGSIWLDYHKDLPLLRLLGVPDFMLSYAPNPVGAILDKYKSQGKPGALKAAAELIRAGFKGNARW